MKLGAYTACLHDKSLVEALDLIGFIPAPHLPIEKLMSNQAARRQ